MQRFETIRASSHLCEQDRSRLKIPWSKMGQSEKALAYRSDTRTRTCYEHGFVEETGGVEQGHSTDERAEGSIVSRCARRQPGQ